MYFRDYLGRSPDRYRRGRFRTDCLWRESRYKVFNANGANIRGCRGRILRKNQRYARNVKALIGTLPAKSHTQKPDSNDFGKATLQRIPDRTMLSCPENIYAMLNPAITTSGVSLWARVRASVRHLRGSLLDRIHAPGRIKEFEYVDPITNETTYLSTGAQYSVLHVGDKQFFFERLTGRFDGTCTSLQERVASGREFCD
jgi:hypothetical protein